MIVESTLRELHDSLHGTDADIAYGHLRHIVEKWEAAKQSSLPQDVVERVAVAICPWFNGSKNEDDPQQQWDEMLASEKHLYRDQAKAAIAALPPEQKVSEEVDYRLKYEKLKEFVRGKWKGDCSECAALANEALNKEQADD